MMISYLLIMEGSVSVLVNLEIPVKKERIEDFFNYLRDILVDTRAYEGCIRLETYHDMENSKVLLIEEWEKIENQESYMQWRTETGLVEALEEFLDGELIIKKYSPKRDV